jgi:hypothetical protein
LQLPTAVRDRVAKREYTESSAAIHCHHLAGRIDRLRASLIWGSDMPDMRREQPDMPPAERRVVDLIAEANATVRAPETLRTRIEAQRPRRTARIRSRAAYGGALAGSLAAVALALILALPSGSGGPSLSQAAALALKGPLGPAPFPDPRAPQVKLRRDIEDVYFPNWQRALGWSAAAQRSDTIDDRQAVTVYYRRQGQEVAYTIVGAPALATPAAQVSLRNGTELRTLTLDGRLTVTWRRAGHTCILSSRDVSAGVLQMLAAWRGPGETA